MRSVVLLAHELLDGNEAGDGQGDDRSQEGLLGDESDDEIGQNEEAYKFHLDTNENWEKRLEKLLLLTSTYGTRNKHSVNLLFLEIVTCFEEIRPHHTISVPL